MKHVTEKYGVELNLLTLTHEELSQLEPFLKLLGVRVRTTIWDSKECTIEADNPYKTWAGHPKARDIADKEMSDFSISCYKR